MVADALLPRQTDNCMDCADPPPCACAANEQCVRINRVCNSCFRNECIPLSGSSSSSSGGVSKGALAGGVVGAIVFFAFAIALFLRYRRRSIVRKTLANARDVKGDIPAAAETVLNRPDPTEKPPSELSTIRVYSSASNITIDLDPHSQASSSHAPSGFNPSRDGPHLNPFDDTNSIQTAGTEGTNVIPIALVPPDSHHASLTRIDSHTLPAPTPTFPVRPARSPDLNLNLDHVNVSHDNLRAANGYSQSTRSGVSGVSSRNSYMSSASYSSDFLNEAPMIMTPTRGAVRQVVGVVKAEVINASAGSLNPSSASDNGKPPAYVRPIGKSPLASTSFGPDDIVKETDESRGTNDPFSDEHSSTHASYAASPSPSDTTFKQDQLNRESAASNWVAENPPVPWSRFNDQSRPSSMSTQAGSVVDIASATRVNVGLSGPKTSGSANSYRTTMGRLVTPPGTVGTLQEQQQRALAHAQAQAQAQGLDRRRVSGSSVLSATSTRADSILESFPFVPPSPISDRPIRTPPVSPLGQQSFTNSSTSPLHQHTFVVAPPSPLTHQSFSAEPNKTTFSSQDDDGVLPAPPNRRVLGLSTGSQLSTASSGLGSFPFQIESEPTTDHGAPPTSFRANGKQRASLDTLALTSDLSSYPLGFDRESVPPPRK
ncbi:unnamed protein product [Cyclocybe aegerita]|uniref:Membrane anchor Opy2 N-terminal domain-containing protein n=1 Tax=Cyclocybe aegerita TaxID=1973307 RepID=A0A8S0WVG2_CYCAE|nr:unnamed protein product [Cyclocybe aegerita]